MSVTREEVADIVDRLHRLEVYVYSPKCPRCRAPMLKTAPEPLTHRCTRCEAIAVETPGSP